jgi:hypothetical protein
MMFIALVRLLCLIPFLPMSRGVDNTKGLFGLCPQEALLKLASQFFGAGFGRP